NDVIKEDNQITIVKNRARLSNNHESNLIANYTFDGEVGNQVLDSSVNNFNGTATNVTRVAGVSGNALSFNGTSSRVDFNNPIIPIGAKSIRFKIKRNGMV